MDERGGVHDLETVAQDTLDAPNYKGMLDKYLPKKGASYSHIPMHVLDEYMAIDVSNTAHIRNHYLPRIHTDKKLTKLYDETLIPASECLSQIESNGIYIDRDWMEDVGVVLQEDMALHTRNIQDLMGYEINPGSPVQMKDAIYNKLKIPNKWKGSTDKDALKAMSEDRRTRHPVILELIKFRKASKAYGTYVKGMRKHIQPNGRIYPTFLLHGTVTGRLACRNPNLQNIPRDWVIRGMIAAQDGKVILEVDLSQAELRCLAALSNDPAMVDLYNDGRSIHKELAVFLFGPDYDLEQYTKCKNVNFGIIYGITQFGLADQINGTLQEAQQMINGWSARFPKAWEYIEKCRGTVKNKQTIVTPFGRKKRVQLITSQNRNFLENEASNVPMQSIASDITLHGAIRTEPRLRNYYGAKIVNLVHDAILVECYEEQVPDIAFEVATAMEAIGPDFGVSRVPFIAEANYGNRWGKDNMSKDWMPTSQEAVQYVPT